MDQSNTQMLNPFSGTHAIVVEYDDIIRSPMLMVMEANKHNDKLSQLIDLQPIKFLYKYGMFEWYCNRHNRNPIQELGDVDDETAYEVMKTFIQSDSRYTTEARPLVFFEPLKVIIAQQFNMEYFVYNEFSNPFIEEDIGKNFPNVAFKILTGPFEDAVKDVPADATWVLSDVTKISKLQNIGKLNLANIMVADDYRYNYQPENPTEFIVDIAKLRESSVFKFRPFMSAALTEEEQAHLSFLLRD